nr:Chain B, ALPHA-SYNUCLEIN PEPTIDE [Homo sapiens]
GYQDYEPEA